VRPEFIGRIEGTTDSEWIYSLLLSQLGDPYGMPETAEVVEATVKALSIIREVRERSEIATSSPANLFISTGRCLVATRFSFDYGWYPEDDTLLETDLPYVSLWYTLGYEYVQRDGQWVMVGSDQANSLLIASEPLTADTSTWLEAPEYSLLSASLEDGALQMEVLNLDV
jgi:glutamine amidotransferase